MKLRTFKIWLFLLPLVGVLGVLLFVQSTNNREELEQQHIRSIASLSKDIPAALADYLVRVDTYIQRKAFGELEGDLGQNARDVQAYLSGFEPEILSLRFVEKSNLPAETLEIQKTKVRIRNRPIQIRKELLATFNQAVTSKSFISGNPENGQNVLLIDLDVPIRELFRKLEKNDYTFQQFFLTDAKGIILYPKEEEGSQIFDPKSGSKSDSLVSYKSGISIQNINYNQSVYRAYSQSINLSPLQLYFVGIYDDAYFQKVGLRINYNLLSILLFTLVVLIASLPILTLVNLGKGDKLSQSRIIQVGISLMALAVVIGFSLSFTKNRIIPVDTLHREIQQAVQEFGTKISHYDSLLEKWDGEKPLTPNQVNEYILIDSKNGFVRNILFVGNSNTPALQVKFDEGISFIDLKDRAYVNYFNTEGDSSRFISSHYSRGSGDLESVISHQIENGLVKAITYTPGLSEVLREDFRILLVKDDGSLLYKTEKVESSISNLEESVSQDKWREIQSLMLNNREISQTIQLESPIYLNGHHYTALLSRVENENFDHSLWSIFMVNTNLYHVFSALTSLEGILFILGYFLFLLGTLLLQQAVRKNENRQGFKSFLFDWLVPTKNRQGKLFFLMIFYFGQFLVILGILVAIDLNHLQTLFLLIYSTLQISFANLLMAKLENVRKKDIPREMTAIFLLGITLLLFSLGINPETGRAMGILSIYGLIFSILGFKTIKYDFLKFEKIGSQNQLSLYLLVWFFMIGFFPGYLIQSKTQKFEQVIWNSQSRSNPIIHGGGFEIYEKARRSMMVALTDPFDPKIQNFIAPDQSLVKAAWEGQPFRLTSNWIPFFFFGILLILTFFTIRWIQDSIFFDFNPHFSQKPIHTAPFNYICCINTDQISDKIYSAHTKKLDFQFETLPKMEEIDSKESFLFLHVHCLDDLMGLAKILGKIKKMGGNVTIYSGTLWKQLYASLQSDREKTVFSEAFSDFNFSVEEIHDPYSLGLDSEKDSLTQVKLKKAFYANIWSELSLEEKLVCYYYAEAGFFNPAAESTLTDLAQKGIIKDNPVSKQEGGWREWRLFSPVFRQFILSNTSKEEIQLFEDYEKKNGNVVVVRTAAISFVLICIAMVGIFDRAFFNEAYAYLTGGLGILGTLYSMFNQGISGLLKGKPKT